MHNNHAPLKKKITTLDQTSQPRFRHNLPAALRTLREVINGEVRRRNPNRELQIITGSPDINDIEPQKQDFDADSSEIGKVVLRDSAGDGGLVPELVRISDR